MLPIQLIHTKVKKLRRLRKKTKHELDSVNHAQIEYVRAYLLG